MGDRWEELADHVAARLDDHVLAFTDTHAMMALGAAGRHDHGARLLASLEAFAETPGNSCARTMEPVAIPICRAILAFAQKDYGQAADLLLPLRPDYIRIGASHAQRDIFHQFLIEAAIGAGRLPLARALLSERTLLKPKGKPAWRKYVQVLTAMGEPGPAAGAGAGPRVNIN